MKEEEKKKRSGKRKSILDTLAALKGKDINKMKPAEQTALLITLCQLMEICDDKAIVK